MTVAKPRYSIVAYQWNKSNIRLGWSSGKNSDDRTVKKVFLEKADGRRKAGRPNLRWLDCIENDLKLMGVKIWRKKAED
jgi:hypothetical protein